MKSQNQNRVSKTSIMMRTLPSGAFYILSRLLFILSCPLCGFFFSTSDSSCLVFCHDLSQSTLYVTLKGKGDKMFAQGKTSV